MATYITPECINCSACVAECPNGAISPGDEYFLINPERCTECVGYHDEQACLSVCPVECCHPNPDRVETEDVLIQRALRIHPKDAELKAKADANNFPSHFRK